MDVTNVFKACIKTVKTRNRPLGVDNERITSSKSNILRSNKTRDVFAYKAKEIVNSVTKLRDFLHENRKAYINTGHISWESSEMKDSERDRIDSDVQIVMRTCAQILREFKHEVLNQPSSVQLKEHREVVCHLIDGYLTNVCQSYGEQRAIRVKRDIDKRRLFRLDEDGKKRRLDNSQQTTSVKTTPVTTPSDDDQIGGESSSSRKTDPRFPFGDDEETPTAEEMQMFEQENERMYNELNTLADEVRQIEGQVVEISKLQEVFTSKILQQEHDLDRIADTVVGTTENIKDANEEIREAMKKNASFRVWILFFLIVMAFSLLFLDWYNP